MKKILLLALSVFTAQSGFSQAGMIAHWNMDSSANDVSGGGHNGHLHNVTPDVGMDGVMGHGYYFNGSNSWISVPASPSFNLTRYSICATVRVNGFYTNTGHTNTIIARGGTGPTGHGTYQLVFSDAPGYTGSGYDTTAECFWTGACASGSSLTPPALTAFNYTPHIVEGQWYKVVGTFNDTVYKIYVDGVLKNTAAILTPGVPMGTSTDSISIGYALYDAGGGFPYQFHGIIDDIQIYNRVLSDSEVAHLGDTCGSILSHPTVVHLPHGGNTTYSVTTSISAPVFQWQVNMGTGFTNLSNAGPYSGVTTATMSVTGVTAAMNNYQYRCLVSNGFCSDTSNSASLLTGVSAVENDDKVSIYPSPVANELHFAINEPIEHCMVSIYNTLGQVLINEDISVNTGFIDVSNLVPGMYIVKMSINGRCQIVRVSKI